MTTQYEELFHDPLDFAIQKTMDDEKYTFVALASQNKCYIKNETTKRIQILDAKTIANRSRGCSDALDIIYKMFFYDYDQRNLHLLEHTWASDMDRDLRMSAFISIVKCVVTPQLTKLIRLGWKPSQSSVTISYYDGEPNGTQLDALLKANMPKKTNRAVTKIMLEISAMDKRNWLGIVKQSFCADYARMYELCDLAYEQFGKTDAKRFMITFIESFCGNKWPNDFETISDILALRRHIPEQSVLPKEENPYYSSDNQIFDKDIRRESTGKRISFEYDQFMDYIEREPDRQAIPKSDMLTKWLDVLTMQLLLTGHINDKYPRNLSTYEDILIREMGTLRDKAAKQKELRDAEKWKCNVGNRLEKYVFKTDEWMTVVPHSPQDMTREATNQHNCLAGYIGTVMSTTNNTDIIFMRRTKKPDKSWITIEYKNGYVRQAYMTCNQSLDDEATECLSQWKSMLDEQPKE